MTLGNPPPPRGRHAVRSFCRFCSALCGVVVTVDEGRVVRVVGDPEHPLSEGYTCPKGRALGAFHHDAHRLDVPLLGRAGGHRRSSDWDETLADLAIALDGIRAEHGPDAIGAFFGNAVFYDAAGFRFGRKLLTAVGSRSVYSAATVDAPSRPYVAELVTGHPLAFARSVDFEHATLTLLVGVNPLVSHGHNSGWPNPRMRLRRLLERGEVWVIDPRRTETAHAATRHLAPRPGTDHLWLAALVRELLHGCSELDELRARADGIDALSAAVEPFTIERAATATGIPPADLEALVARIREHGRIAVLGGTGISMAASANVTEWLLWALLVVTGSIDAEGGTWVNPGFLRGLDRRHWEPGEATPASGPASRPALPNRLGEHPAAALVDELEGGNVRALLVFGGNPITSLPESDRVRRALGALDVLATVDVVHTATTDVSTHVLPTAGQLERADLPAALDINYAGVATQYTPACIQPGATRWPTWRIAAALGARLGAPLLDDDVDIDALDDDDVLAPIAANSPVPFTELRGAARCIIGAPAVYGWMARSVLPNGRFRIAPQPLVDQLRSLDRAGQHVPTSLVLVPRRQLRHLNSQLVSDAAPSLLVHPADARAHDIDDGDAVVVSTSTGSINTRAELDSGIIRGAVSLPHGFEGTNVNDLRSGVELDPLTGMVEYTGVPVTLARRPISSVEQQRS